MNLKLKHLLPILFIVMSLLVVLAVFTLNSKSSNKIEIVKGTCEQAKSSYLGLSENQATVKAKAEGREFRITSRNGEYYNVTMDFNSERLNFSIENDKIKSAGCG